MANQGITMRYDSPYRGAREEWTQQYHFTESAPGDGGAWHDLAISLAALTVSVLPSSSRVIGFYGYTDTDNDAVYSEDWIAMGTTMAGTFDQTGKVIAPGDDAVWLRWKTSRNNSNGKPIYLRKYFHAVVMEGNNTEPDVLDSDYHDALLSLVDDIQGPSSDWPGLAGPSGDETFLGTAVSTYSTTRTLKRRGRRP